MQGTQKKLPKKHQIVKINPIFSLISCFIAFYVDPVVDPEVEQVHYRVNFVIKNLKNNILIYANFILTSNKSLLYMGLFEKPMTKFTTGLTEIYKGVQL